MQSVEKPACFTHPPNDLKERERVREREREKKKQKQKTKQSVTKQSIHEANHPNLNFKVPKPA